LQSNKSNPHAKTKAHLGDQAGISRGVHAPAAPGIAASSMPPCPRHPTRAACGRCVVRAPAGERERSDGVSASCPHRLQKSRERERDQMGLCRLPPHRLQKSRGEREENHRKAKITITASLIRIRKQTKHAARLLRKLMEKTRPKQEIKWN